MRSLRCCGRIALLGGACVLAALLGGCMVGPNYQTPSSTMPAAWIGPTTAPTTQQSVTSADPADIARWWMTFNDPVLNGLIQRAIESNLDLKQAESRIRQARASRGIIAAGFWPTLDSSASYRRAGSGAVSAQTDLYRAGLDAAWELDVFGGVRRNIESAEADIAAAVEDRHDVLVSLSAEVALSYLDYRGFGQEIVIVRRNLQAQQHSADVTHAQFMGGHGFVGGLDVANSDAQVATTLSQIPLLEQAQRQALYSLSVLLALPPDALLPEMDSSAPIPTVPPHVPVGLPSDLLRRRPDIRRAEQQLHAATAQIGVATADLFPKFSLTGSLALAGDKPKSLFNWNNSIWSLGPTISWPVFDAGRIRANIEVQNALQEQALLAYQKAVLIALQDVENALIAYEKEQQHHDALAKAVEQNRHAVDLAMQLYREGQTDFLNVLSAQRSLFLTEDALVQSDRTLATNLVALYKALGGGWEEAAPPATSPAAGNP